MNIIGWLMMRPPILLARSCFCYFSSGPSCFLLRGFLLLLGDPWARHLEVSFLGFYLLLASFTFWAFSPFFPQDKVQPHKQIILKPGQGDVTDEQEIR
jgi:hypothetical protein